LLHPRANERDQLPPKEEPIIAMSKRAERMPPGHTTHGHAT
jgi:hypothetical protein